jgi:type II secretion system protein D
MPAPAQPGTLAPAPAGGGAATAPPAAPEKTVTVMFDRADWESVLSWFATESGLTPIYNVKPTGSVTLKSPKGRGLTMGEVVDLLNDAMMQQKFILVRRRVSFTILPVDEKVDGSAIPRIELEELPKRGTTELVQVLLPLKTLSVEDTAPEVKQWLTPFGTVTSVVKMNTLILMDTAGNINRIVQTLKKVEEQNAEGDILTHRFVYRKATEEADKLKTLLTDKDSTVTVAGAPGATAQPYVDPRTGQPYYSPQYPQYQQYDRNQPRAGPASGRVKSVAITVDVKSNSITITAPPEKIALAKRIIEENDKPLYKDQPPVRVTDPELRKYAVPAGTADAISKAIGEKNPSIRVVPLVQTSEIMVYGTAEDHLLVAALLKLNDGATAVPETVVIPLAGSDPAEMVKTLTGLFPATAPNAPSISAQPGGMPGIIVKGTPDKIAEVRKAVETIEGRPAAGSPGFDPKSRTLFIPDGSTSVLAEHIGRVLNGTGRPTTVIDPNNPQKPLIPNPKIPPAQKEEPKGKESGKPLSSGMREALPGRDIRLAGAQITDPEKKDAKGVTIEVRGNRLIVTSDDPKTLDLVADLIQYYRPGAPAQENLFKVIRLRNVAAADAAKEITEIFNGPQQQQGGPGGGRGGNPLGAILGGGGGGGILGSLLGGGGAPAVSGATPNRVRVVAETASNSLVVVKASPIDLLTIEKLLRDYIDGGPSEDALTLKTHIVKVRNADAAEMASIVREVFRAATAAGSAGQVANTAFPFPFAPQPQQQQQQKPPALSIAVDDRSNSLILQCTEQLKAEIETLVTSLDEATVSTTEVVKLVQLKGVDPTLVQQAVYAIQGLQVPQTGQRPGGFGGNQGGFGGGTLGGGLGQGGFGGLGGGGLNFGGLGGGFGGGLGGGTRGTGIGGVGGGRGTGGGLTAPRGGGTTAPRGGGGGTRGGGRQANAGGTEGPLNFDYRGKDAPPALVSKTLYDPVLAAGYDGHDNSPTVPVRHQPDPAPAAGQPPAAGGAAQPMPGQAPGTIQAPRGRADVQLLPGLDTAVIRASDAQDLQLILDLIEVLREQAKTARPRLEVIPLEYADPNSIANFLTALFSRVLVAGPGGNYLLQPAATGQPALGLGGGFGQQQQNVQNRGVYLLALPRQNAILVAAPESRFADVLKEIRRFDVKHDPATFPKPFRLQKASAQIAATQIQQFWNARFPGDPLALNQFRVTFDAASNTVYVQASKADLEDVEALLREWDTAESKAVSEVRIFPLRSAVATELAQVISNALTAQVLNPLNQAQFQNVQAPSAGGTAQLGLGTGQTGLGGGQGVLGGALGGALGGGAQGALGGALGAALGQQGGQLPGGVGTTGQIQTQIPSIGVGIAGGLVTKSNTLRVYSVRDGQVIESGHFADVHLVPNVRTNAIIVTAPEKTMRLIAALIDQLDTVAAAAAFVNVFELRRADATLTANLLRQLFGAQTQGGGLGGQFGGQLGGQLGGFGQLGAAQQPGLRPVLTLTGDPSPGANLIDLRISTDDRTNSIIVAGSPNDLETIRAIIYRLESSDVGQRYNEVYKLRNAAAADVATAVSTFVQQSLAVLTQANFLSAYQNLQRSVVVIAEPVSNTLLVSATPQYFGEIKRLIEKVDAQPPQVMVQVMIVDVQLNNAEEFGVEFGIQSPVLFARGQLGAPVTNTTTGQVNAAVPGFNFNTTAPLGNSNIVQQQTVGFQGLSQLGVGRVGTQGFGGFVFSAASDSFNLLIRALKAQGRVEILSRPQIQVADNQTGFVQVGQDFPFLSTANATLGVTQQSIEYRPIGVTMRVTPRVNPDGKVLMRVEPAVSSVSPNSINLGNGILAPVFNNQTVQTTVLAADGETIVLGGLISRTDSRTENGYPFLKDIPYVGALFRYRTHTVQRREVLVIMTPHVVRSEADQARLLAEEGQKMTWCVPELARTHGHGLEVIGPAMHGARPVPVPGPVPYAPGPYYHGGLGTPDPAGPQPGYPPQLPPAYPQQQQPGYPPQQQPGGQLPPYNPGMNPAPGGTAPAPGGTTPPGGMPPALPTPPPAPPQPGVGYGPPAPQAPGGWPAAAGAPVAPVAAVIPMPQPQPAYPPQAAPAARAGLQMVMPDGRPYVPPGTPAPTPPPAPVRGAFTMQQPAGRMPAGGQPARSGDGAPPADDRKTNRATEGEPWNSSVFERSFFGR